VKSYFYIIPTLPALSFTAAPPFGMEEFFARCLNSVDAEELAVLESASLSFPEGGEDSSPSRILDACRVWDRSLRNELARLRAGRRGLRPEMYFRSGREDLDALRTASAAFHAENPFEAEIIMEKARWELVESLKSGRFFDFEILMAYCVELLILNRVASFETEKGFMNYRSIHGAILGAVES
jgi:hypothetical protein